MSNLLEDAQALVEGQRAQDYGDIQANFTRIAGLWSAYLGVCITAHDVAYMMVLLKVSRLRQNTRHKDGLIDIVGYSLCADRLV